MTILRTLAALARSKKAVMAVLTLIATAVGYLGFDFDPAALYAAIAPLIAYILGQGIADAGKERAIVEAAAGIEHAELSRVTLQAHDELARMRKILDATDVEADAAAAAKPDPS